MAELFDYKKPKVETVYPPSRAQLRMLHILARGRLSFHSWPYPRFELKDLNSEVDQGWRFHQATARIVVDRGWAVLRMLDMRHGKAEYFITTAGQALIEEICQCAGRGLGALSRRGAKSHEKQIEKLCGKMLCRVCARRVPCVSRKAMVHAGSRWHWKWGAVCETHWRRLAG